MFIFKVAVDEREGSVEVFFLVGDEVDNGVGVVEGSNEDFGEEEDGVGEYGGVTAHEHHFLLEHEQGEQVQEDVKGEEGEDEVGPLFGEGEHEGFA